VENDGLKTTFTARQLRYTPLPLLILSQAKGFYAESISCISNPFTCLKTSLKPTILKRFFLIVAVEKSIKSRMKKR